MNSHTQITFFKKVLKACENAEYNLYAQQPTWSEANHVRFGIFQAARSQRCNRYQRKLRSKSGEVGVEKEVMVLVFDVNFVIAPS